MNFYNRRELLLIMMIFIASFVAKAYERNGYYYTITPNKSGGSVTVISSQTAVQTGRTPKKYNDPTWWCSESYWYDNGLPTHVRELKVYSDYWGTVNTLYATGDYLEKITLFDVYGVTSVVLGPEKNGIRCYIADGAFKNSSKTINYIRLNNSIYSIGSEAFIGMNSGKIICGNTPPYLSSSAFCQEAYDNIVVIVPSASYDKYKKSNWSNFKNLVDENAIIVPSFKNITNEIKVGQIKKLELNGDIPAQYLKWESSDDEIATVKDGVVTGVSPGTAIVTVTNTLTGDDAIARIIVKEVEATGIILNPMELSLLIGSSQKLMATVIPDNVTDKTIVWTSDRPEIVAVSKDGMATAISIGTATITASCGDVCTTCKVTVAPIVASSILLNSQNLSLFVGSIEKLTASVTPDNTTDKTVTWKSDNEAVATVMSDGTVTAISVGTARITATCGDISAICEVTVKPIVASSIALSEIDLSLFVGSTEKLTTTITPDNTTDKTVTWKSDNEAVATVTSDGTISAISEGITTITATCGDISAICKVTVKPIVASNIALSEIDHSLFVGSTEKLTAIVTPDNTTYKTVTWESDNEAVATVATDGTVTAISVGIVTITATCGEVSATCKITVKPVEASAILLDTKELTLCIGTKEKVTATVTPDNTTDKTIIWKSDNDAIATVMPDGTVTAVSVGKTIIIATCGDVSATCKVAVNPIETSSIELSMKDVEIPIGTKITLTAKVYPDNATYKEIVWLSSNNAIANIDQDGSVTAVSVGVCDIIAMSAENTDIKATCSIRVLPILVESISLNPNEIQSLVGDLFNIRAIVLPENATNKNIKWSSSDEDIASVDSMGKVTIHKEGFCKIIACASDGSDVTAECTITSLSEIDELFDDSVSIVSIYTIQGNILHKDCTYQDFKSLSPGIYIFSKGSVKYKVIIH